VTESDGGSNVPDDDEYYELMRASMDGFSTAGAAGGYIYFAKRVSTQIADVVANTPSDGVVKIYTLMQGGALAGAEIKKAVLDACDAGVRRPLTDHVLAGDAEVVNYDIRGTYYLQDGAALSAAEAEAAVQNAVAQYTAWQSARLGRDINPSRLIGLLMQTGIKRVELTAPVFTVLRDGSEKNAPAPQVAVVQTVQLQNGGYENE